MAFEQITDEGYMDLLVRRLHDETPLTWLQQAREILEPHVPAATSLTDVGCATGYGAKVFPELAYLGVDVEDQYLDIGRQHFAGDDRIRFLSHDLVRAPIAERGDLLILNAVLEHCPSLDPVLGNILDSTGQVALLRVFLGEAQQIHTVPSPKPAFADRARKFSNQYAFLDLFRILDRHGFSGELIRDRYTDSLPRYVDGVMRTFYFVKATRISA